MTARTIIQWPNPKLFKSAERVEDYKEALQISEDLYHTMITAYGAGLAATQVGIEKSVCVITSTYAPSISPDRMLEEKCVVLINPVIEFIGDEIFEWEEACLSVPNIRARVKRQENIKLTYTNLEGQETSVVLSGIESATVQHEVDHLHGKLFIHRLTGYSRERAMNKLKKAEKIKKIQAKEESAPKIGRPKRKRSKNPKTYGKKKR